MTITNKKIKKKQLNIYLNSVIYFLYILKCFNKHIYCYVINHFLIK